MTIKDIARLAGVSIATVSRVINNSGPVKEALREQVLRAIEQTGYKPNQMARGLSRSQSMLVGVIVPVLHTWFERLISGLSEVLEPAGYSILTGATGRESARLCRILELYMEKQIDALLLQGQPIDTQSRSLLATLSKDIPLIFIDQDQAGLDAHSIQHDNTSGAAMLMEHLLSKGHTRIAYIGGYADDATNRIRHAAYTEALDSAGIPVLDSYTTGGRFSYRSGLEGIEAILAGNAESRPTAVFCANDLTAIGCMRGLYNAGLAVPDDISVCGFDNADQAAYTIPSLTTVEQNQYEAGRRAGALILSPPPQKETIILKQTLIIRESTALCSTREDAQ